jgi:hypothetical protein
LGTVERGATADPGCQHGGATAREQRAPQGREGEKQNHQELGGGEYFLWRHILESGLGSSVKQNLFISGTSPGPKKQALVSGTHSQMEGSFVYKQTNSQNFFTIARFAGASKWCSVSEGSGRFMRKMDWSVLGGLGLSRRIPEMQSMCREVSAWESARDHHEYKRNL